jgi:Ca2+-binding RTX toxin-like protein
MRSGLWRLVLATMVAAGLTPMSVAHAAVTSEVVDAVLEVAGDDSDGSIEVTCVGGDVKVNGADPDSGAYACAGIVFIIISAAGGVDHVTLADVDEASFPTLQFCRVDGGAGDDVLIGSQGPDALTGREGADTLSGGRSSDELKPGVDGGTVDGGSGTDRVVVSGGGRWRFTDAEATRLSPDPLSIPLTSIEEVESTGGPGPDRMDASDYGGGVVLKGNAGGDRLRGSSHGDLLIGGDGDDVLPAGAGNDSVLAGGGDDLLRGQSGRDFMRGGGGRDRCRGGPGRDDAFECEVTR